MTSMQGRSLSFTPGKVSPNMEHNHSQENVTIAYKAHREKVIKMKPVTDSKNEIPDFMKNRAWKKYEVERKKKALAARNAMIYNRITKVEDQGSVVKKEVNAHSTLVTAIREYSGNVREVRRVKTLLKLQRENEYILSRIENAKPAYNTDSLRMWYKPHVLFKVNRRSNPTSLHLLSGVERLLPKSLPPLSLDEGSLNGSLARSDATRESVGRYLSKASFSNADSSVMLSSSPDKSFANTQAVLQSAGRSPSSYRFSNYEESSGKISFLDENIRKIKPLKFQPHNRLLADSNDPTVNSSSYSLKSATSVDNSDSILTSGSHLESASGADETDGEDIFSNALQSEGIDSKHTIVDAMTLPHFEDGCIILSQRVFALPQGSRNCTVQVTVNSESDKQFRIKAFRISRDHDKSTSRVEVIAEKIVAVSAVKELVGSANFVSLQSGAHDDLDGLKVVMSNMFKEADREKNGYLTFDEFQNLLEKMDLGISSQDMRFVISEADENDNGVVEYEEFVPIAVDLIQSFRARNQAATESAEDESAIDEIILDALADSNDEIKQAVHICLAAIQQIDDRGYGVLHLNELKRCLAAVRHVFAGDKEVTMVCQMLKRDQLGRCRYDNLEEVIWKVRFMTMKNNFIEARGSQLHKYLLERCREEDAKLRLLHGGGGNSTEAESGRIPFRVMKSILTSSTRLSLSPLQVTVLMADLNLQEGHIDYCKFVPIVAKTIEHMFEPKALRQRAELVFSTDFSPEVLLKAPKDEFHTRVHLLFKSYDLDHKETLSSRDVYTCLKSLDLVISMDDVESFRRKYHHCSVNDSDITTAPEANIESDGVGEIYRWSFEDFFSFFSDNLLALERLKHVRSIQKLIKSREQFSEQACIDHLLKLFQLVDQTNAGCVTVSQFKDIVKSIGVDISEFQMEYLIAELNPPHLTASEKIQYSEFLSVIAEILEIYKAKELSHLANEKKKTRAAAKAKRIMNSSKAQVNQIVHFVKEKLRLLEATVDDEAERSHAIHEALINPHSELSIWEAHFISSRLFTERALRSRSRYSFQGVSVGRDKHQLRSLTFSELKETVAKARLETILHVLMEDTDPNSIYKSVLRALENEVSVVYGTQSQSWDEELNDDFLPMSACYTALDSMSNLGLSKVQIMALISWMGDEFYDSGGMEVHYQKFAAYLARAINWLRSHRNNNFAMMETSTADDTVHALLSENDIRAHLYSALSPMQTADGKISVGQFFSTVSTIPKVSLSEADIKTLAIAFPPASGNRRSSRRNSMLSAIEQQEIVWEDFVTWLHQNLNGILKVKQAASGWKEEKETVRDAKDVVIADMKNNSDKLINLIKLKQNEDSEISISIPGYDSNNTDGLSRLLLPSQDDFDVEKGMQSLDSAHETLLFRTIVFLPTRIQAVAPEVSRAASRSSLLLQKPVIPSFGAAGSGFAANRPSSLLELDSLGPSHRMSRHRMSMALPSRDNAFKIPITTASRRNSAAIVGLHAAPDHMGTSLTSGDSKLVNDVSSSLQWHLQESSTDVDSTSHYTRGKCVVMLRVLAVSANTFADKDLVIVATSVDGSYHESFKLPVRLPTIAVMDKEVARRFAQNTIEKLVLELPNPLNLTKSSFPISHAIQKLVFEA